MQPVAGSSRRVVAAQRQWANHVPLVTEQHNLVEAKGRCYSAIGKLTAGVAETVTAAYRRDYTFAHLQANCPEPGSALEPLKFVSSMGLLLPTFCNFTDCLHHFILSLYLFHSHNAVKIRQKNIKTLGMKKDNKARSALTVDPYTTRHNSVNCTSIKYKL